MRRLLALCLLAYPRGRRTKDGAYLLDLALELSETYGVGRQALSLLRGGLAERVRRRPRRGALLVGGVVATGLVLFGGGLASGASGGMDVEVYSCSATTGGGAAECAASRLRCTGTRAPAGPASGRPRATRRRGAARRREPRPPRRARPGRRARHAGRGSAARHRVRIPRTGPARGGSICQFLDRTLPRGASGTLVAVQGRRVLVPRVRVGRPPPSRRGRAATPSTTSGR